MVTLPGLRACTSLRSQCRRGRCQSRVHLRQHLTMTHVTKLATNLQPTHNNSISLRAMFKHCSSGFGWYTLKSVFESPTITVPQVRPTLCTFNSLQLIESEARVNSSTYTGMYLSLCRQGGGPLASAMLGGWINLNIGYLPPRVRRELVFTQLRNLTYLWDGSFHQT